MFKYTETEEYKASAAFYGDRTAERSKVPLINHIHEGVDILREIGATELAIKAYCIHPIVQNEEPEEKNLTNLESYKLAVEYRRRANAYLCKPVNDHIDTAELVYIHVGDMSRDCRDMLYADKKQNQKDFLIHHQNHERFKQLDLYFKLWLEFLSTKDVKFLDGWMPIESAPENIGVYVGWWENTDFHYAVAYQNGGKWFIARTGGKECFPKFWDYLKAPPKART